MTRIYAILAAIGGAIAAVFAAFLAGGRNAKAKLDAKQSKAELETYKDSRHAQDEMLGSSDDDITGWLRKRSGE